MTKIFDNKNLGKVNKPVDAQAIKEQSNITDEPQTEEHLHMKLLGESAPLKALYINISDDAGQFFGNMNLEEKMIDFLGQSKTLARNGSAEAIKQMMPQLIAVSKAYQRQINFATNVSNGILVKHQIRLGNIFLYQKRLLKKTNPEMDWTEWFNKTYSSSNLRSAQDYMRLAKTPNIIRYAVFGKERLIEILRAITSFASNDDPIGAFLSKYGFIYDPEGETSMDDWRSNIDAAIAMEKIKLAEKKEDLNLELSFDEVKKWVSSNGPLDSKVINDMIIIKEADGNVKDYLETSVLANGRQNIQIERSEKKESVQRISKKLKEIVEFYTKDTSALSEINVSAVNDLKQSVESLITLLNK
jgi:hypothetical protein